MHWIWQLWNKDQHKLVKSCHQKPNRVMWWCDVWPRPPQGPVVFSFYGCIHLLLMKSLQIHVMSPFFTGNKATKSHTSGWPNTSSQPKHQRPPGAPTWARSHSFDPATCAVSQMESGCSADGVAPGGYAGANLRAQGSLAGETSDDFGCQHGCKKLMWHRNWKVVSHQPQLILNPGLHRKEACSGDWVDPPGQVRPLGEHILHDPVLATANLTGQSYSNSLMVKQLFVTEKHCQP